MYATQTEKIREQLGSVVAIINPRYIETLVALHKKLSKRGLEWTISGDLGEALKTVQIEPDCVEIVTNRKGAAEIFLSVQDCNPTGVFFQTQQLTRNALVDGKEYPAFVRSYYFEFTLNGIRAKVYGDLQFKISNWSWGDKFEFTPEVVYVAGVKTNVVPLSIKNDLYQSLGWSDRAEKVQKVLTKHAKLARRKGE